MAIGMWLFLASLSMLFFAGMLMYILFSVHVFGRTATIPVHLPAATWVSTLVLIAGSFTIHRALANVRVQRLNPMRVYLYATTALAVIFLIIQFPCMWVILQSHRAALNKAVLGAGGITANPVPLDGLVFCLILLHALHVIGGVIAMVVITVRAAHNRYDHENYMGVRHAALYWHFLDIIWLMMFSIFLITAR
jgi:heme/copper-type cytochrome/quinol oxidase subunit 3